MPDFSPAQLTILRIIDAFDGRLTPADIAGFAKGVAELPDVEFMPIEPHLAELHRLGLVEVEEDGDVGPRYRTTARGMEIAAE